MKPGNLRPPAWRQGAGKFLARAAVWALALGLGAPGAAALPGGDSPLPARPGPRRETPNPAEEQGRALRGHGGPEIYTLEFPDNELVGYYEERFSSPAYAAWLRGVRERSLLYIRLIRREVEERELPWELAYLPAVESAFQIHAVSSSGAAGLWQFMTNSIGPYGMIVDEWRDDRRDFVKATAGALQKLADNYRVLGDWFLALAAYNCGLGRVQRTLAQSGLSTYWELCEGNLLPAQTIHFVPRLLALSRLLGYPGRRGLELDWTPPLEWARIPLNRGVDLRLLAGASGVPYEVLLAGNASLRYGISPQEYELKVPAEFSDVVTRVLSESQNELLRFYLYRIKPGDTLYGLSRHYEVPLSLIERHNPQLRAELLRVGETVIIPALKEKEPYPGRSVQTAAPRADWTGVYRVAPGDTLWGIARRFSLGVQELAGNNGLDPEGLLLAGTVLQVPASGP